MIKRYIKSILRYFMSSSIESDAYIESVYQWNKEEIGFLGIVYVNAENIGEIIVLSLLDEQYQQLELKGWDEQKFLLNHDQVDSKSRKVQTIIQKIINVIKKEEKENQVESLVMSLMGYLGFDEYPFMMHPRYDYNAIIGGHRITYQVEYMVTIRNRHVILIVENKQNEEDWAEHRIAGEIIGSAFHNANTAGNSYPFFVYVIRIVNTKFTFYKATITREYLEECSYSLVGPVRNQMIVKRYPSQVEASSSQSRTLTAWDFIEEDDRRNILGTLKGLMVTLRELR